MPDLAEARLYDSLAGDQRDNAFGINDAGVVVGSFGARLNPCAVIDPIEMTEPRAFVRLPKPGTQMGLSGSLPGLVAVDLHVAGGLPALLPPPPPGPPGSRSTANGVSESSRYVVGHAGYDLLQDGKAWLWDLRLGTEFSGTGSSVAFSCVITLASDFNGDLSGASPCDLHVILPCGGSGEGIGEGSGQAQAASSGASQSPATRAGHRQHP